MNTLPTFGVFSTHSLMLDGMGANIGRDKLVKRMAILFDRLLFFPIGLGPVGTPDSLFTKLQVVHRWVGDDPAVVEEVGKFVSLDHELIEDIEGFYSQMMHPEQHDLWSGESSQKFVDFCTRYVDERYSTESPRDRWEMYKAHIGYINSDYRFCQIVNREFDDCSALITELHEQAVIETLSTEADSSMERISTIVGDLRSFDFGTLSWAQVLELRRSGFVQDYRSRVAEWVLSHRNAGSVATKLSLESFIQEAMFELVGATEPNVRETILSGIGGNLPSPIGVNPFSVFAAVQDARKAHSLKSQFGWLYFINRARNATKQNAG